MKYLITAVVVIITCLTSQKTHAQGQERLFNQYIMDNKYYANQLEIKAKRVFNRIYSDCDSQSGYIRLKPQVIIPYRFTLPIDTEIEDINFNEIHPSFGQWIERSRITACGQRATINTLVVAYDTSAMPVMYPLVNGDTKIDTQYQSIAENIILDEISSKKSCAQKGVVMDSRLIGYRSSDNSALVDNDDNAGWFEKWVVKACQKIHNVNLAILPDPRTQYQYIADLDKTDEEKEE